MARGGNKEWCFSHRRFCHTASKPNRASVLRPIKTLPYSPLPTKQADLSAVRGCWAKASVGRCEQFGSCMAKLAVWNPISPAYNYETIYRLLKTSTTLSFSTSASGPKTMAANPTESPPPACSSTLRPLPVVENVTTELLSLI